MSRPDKVRSAASGIADWKKDKRKKGMSRLDKVRSAASGIADWKKGKRKMG